MDNLRLLTMAINPKEYLELLKDRVLNKKYKGIKKGSSDLGFENFAQRIKLLINFNMFEKPPLDQKQVSRLTVVAGEIVKKKKKTVTKSKFSRLSITDFIFQMELFLYLLVIHS